MKRNLGLILVVLVVVSTGGCYVGIRQPYDFDRPFYYSGSTSYRQFECPALDQACNAEVGRQRGTARALAERAQSAATRAEQKAYCAAGGLECGGKDKNTAGTEGY